MLQARTTSSRLPAKVLLPLAGLPLAVLAARRVSRDGLDVVLATSDEEEDDLLARIVGDAGISVIRGPLKDVLARFLMATSDLSDDAICVRVTSDNPCPDGDFIATLIDQFILSGDRYLAYGNDGAWLPYGLSAEAFSVGDLRQVHHAADTLEIPEAYVHEHVTPTLRASFAPKIRAALPGCAYDLGHLRCTVDTLDDYLRMAKLFADRSDPVSVSWRELVSDMADQSPKTPAGLVLGTVQLGLPYGITAEAGLMPAAEARAILDMAARHGCVAVDTARAYGESEKRIGSLGSFAPDMTIITKLAPIDTADQTKEELMQSVTNSIDESTAALKTGHLDTVLLHRASHIEVASGAIWRQMVSLCDAGRIRRLGVSVQSPTELLSVLSLPEVKHIQLPFNLLDWRWEPCITALRERPDVTVHARSVFLQGLLLQKDASKWPSTAEKAVADDIMSGLAELSAELGRSSVADLCVAYVRAFSWLDGIVIGVDSAAQLEEITGLFAQPPLHWDEVVQVQRRMPRVSERLLNPALWHSEATG